MSIFLQEGLTTEIHKGLQRSLFYSNSCSTWFNNSLVTRSGLDGQFMYKDWIRRPMNICTFFVNGHNF